MKRGMAFLLFAMMALTIAPLAAAKNAPEYEKGTLLSMDSKACGAQLNSGKSLTGELLGTDSEHKKTEELLCQEYILQAEHIVYHIRPKDEKHPALLPIGEGVEFRIRKDALYLRSENDKKEREYTVISMQPRQEVKETKDAKEAKNTEAKNSE
jgi:hypothetical protein